MAVSLIKLKTFGFKYGIPRVNYYIDVTFIKNPAREANSHLDAIYNEDILRFVESQPDVPEYVQCIANLIEVVSGLDFEVVFGIGCNSGKHRSRAVAELIGNEIFSRGIEFEIEHTDIQFG
jgi:UPF0042 nucleotide-binding protein